MNLSKDSIHKNHRLRVKNRFLNNGLDSFEQHAAMEMLLFYSIPQGDTNELAHKLINTFGSFDKVLDASYEDLCAVDGVGSHTATLIKLIPAFSKYYDEIKHQPKIKLSTANDVAEYVQARYKHSVNEVFSLISLDSNLKFLKFDEISTGTVSYTEVSTRKAVDAALKSNAACAIIAHNHPSGNLKPSIEDMLTTRAMREALKLIGVRLVDHIIVSKDGYVSIGDLEAPKNKK